MSNSDWKLEKERKRLERKQAQISRVLAAPPTRAEVFGDMNDLLVNIASLGTAIEALEQMLIEKGVLKDDELMDRCVVIAKTKSEQARAAAATSDKGEGLIVAPD